MAIINTEKEYQRTLNLVQEADKEEKKEIKVLKKKYKGKSLKMGLEMLKTQYALRDQMKDQLKEYESIKKGEIPEYMKKFDNFGLLLIALRIKKGWSQSQLARSMNIKPSQVSRNERNEYHGVSLPTIKKILKTLGYRFKIELE